MRLILMAQGDSRAILEAVKSLPDVDQSVLYQEMAVTGLAGQHYTCEFENAFFAMSSMRVQRSESSKGPAILVYYGPALMQKAGKKDPKGALAVLAEVYRATRKLFPLTGDMASSFVTVRVDTLKELEVTSIRQPEPGLMFVVVKTSAVDANVRLLSLADVKDLKEDAAHEVLDFHYAKESRPLRWVRKKESKASCSDIAKKLSGAGVGHLGTAIKKIRGAPAMRK
jgi:hypothetical protein